MESIIVHAATPRPACPMRQFVEMLLVPSWLCKPIPWWADGVEEGLWVIEEEDEGKAVEEGGEWVEEEKEWVEEGWMGKKLGCEEGLAIETMLDDGGWGNVVADLYAEDVLTDGEYAWLFDYDPQQEGGDLAYTYNTDSSFFESYYDEVTSPSRDLWDQSLGYPCTDSCIGCYTSDVESYHGKLAPFHKPAINSDGAESSYATELASVEEYEYSALENVWLPTFGNSKRTEELMSFYNAVLPTYPNMLTVEGNLHNNMFIIGTPDEDSLVQQGDKSGILMEEQFSRRMRAEGIEEWFVGGRVEEL
ncbi:hypothetical protein AMATHDRAFT_4138 [Amanita thiersii Skay4041]|uniref:Uncharacterized protein n=1 Tax=Amanita thiersii Skay4041 TaxID=703135 RepID=A0A2A9NR45_9AGAR|nr:hypothetical protein AMATHDRAFT_4138 [Amanita thiersii Skay4041]